MPKHTWVPAFQILLRKLCTHLENVFVEFSSWGNWEQLPRSNGDDLRQLQHQPSDLSAHSVAPAWMCRLLSNLWRPAWSIIHHRGCLPSCLCDFTHRTHLLLTVSLKKGYFFSLFKKSHSFPTHFEILEFWRTHFQWGLCSVSYYFGFAFHSPSNQLAEG